MQKVGWDPVEDLAPITLAISSPNVLVVHPSLPLATDVPHVDLVHLETAL